MQREPRRLGLAVTHPFQTPHYASRGRAGPRAHGEGCSARSVDPRLFGGRNDAWPKWFKPQLKQPFWLVLPRVVLKGGSHETLLNPHCSRPLGRRSCSCVALAQDAIVTTDLNMRAGPSTAFPVVDVLEERTLVEVHGCVSGYSWCDVSENANRGWVSGAYLSYAAGGSYVPLVEYVSDYDVPIISFSVGSYW